MVIHHIHSGRVDIYSDCLTSISSVCQQIDQSDQQQILDQTQDGLTLCQGEVNAYLPSERLLLIICYFLEEQWNEFLITPCLLNVALKCY